MIIIFNILCREGVLCSCIEITALFGVVPTIGSGKIMAFVLRIGGAVIVIANRVAFSNRM